MPDKLSPQAETEKNHNLDLNSYRCWPRQKHVYLSWTPEIISSEVCEAEKTHDVNPLSSMPDSHHLKVKSKKINHDFDHNSHHYWTKQKQVYFALTAEKYIRSVREGTTLM